MKNNRSLNTTLSDDKGKEETDFDESDETKYTDNIAFNVIVDMKNTAFHNAENFVDDDDSIYNDEDDEEVTFYEL